MKKTMAKRKITLLALLLAAGSVQAALVASESFEYDTTAGGTKLSNTVYQGGTGWGTFGSSAGSYTNGWSNRTNGGLDLDDSNGGLGSSLGETNSVGNLALSITNGANARSLATGMSLNSSWYCSFLARTDVAGKRFRIETSYTTPAKAVRWMPFELLADGKIKTQAGNTSATSAASLWQPGKTYLVVNRFKGAAGSVTDYSHVKIFDINNPDQTNYLTEVAWETDADVVAAAATGVSALDIYMTASDPGVEIDELKFGQTYADVVQNYTVTVNNPDLVFAYENFDYTAGAILAGGTLNGGTNWNGGWQKTTATGLPLHGADESLWFGNFEGLFNEDETTMIGAAAGGEASERTLGTPVDLNSKVLYFAALVRGDSTSQAAFVLTAGGTVEAAFGLLDKDGSGDLDLFVHPSDENYPTNYVATNVFASGTTYLLVMKRTATDLSASLLPGNGFLPSEPATWDVTVSDATSASLDKLKIALAAGSLYVDEIGMGSTFAKAIESLPVMLPFDGVYAYDTFDYQPGTSLAGKTGGLGWSAAWNVGTAPQNPMFASGRGSSLWFGNTEAFSLDGSTHASAGDSSLANRMWSRPHDLTTQGPLYFAVLVRQGTGDTRMRLELADSGGQTRFAMGLADDVNNPDGIPNLFVRQDGTVFPYSNLTWSVVNAPPDTNLLLFGKRTSTAVYASLFVGGDTNSLVEPATWDVELANSSGLAMSMCKMAVSTGPCRIDEFAVGNSYEAVIRRLPVTFTSEYIDGVPVYWILDYWASTNEYNAAADDDIDGLDNNEEYLADTNPIDDGSVLRGIGLAITATNTVFSYQNGGRNADVYVEYRDNLLLGDWTPVATNYGPTSITNIFVNDMVGGDTEFYRLRGQRND